MQLLKSAQSSKCARQRIGTLPRAICELKAQKKLWYKRDSENKFVHMKHGGSKRWGETVDQMNISISVWPEDVYLQDIGTSLIMLEWRRPSSHLNIAKQLCFQKWWFNAHCIA